MNGSRPVALFALVSLLVIAAGSTAFAKTINVPGDKPTIQKAIDAAVNGDVVLVAKGTYRENLNFKGKAITVESTNPTDPAVVRATIIDGGQNGSVVTFKSGEQATSVLTGFTLTNGSGTAVYDKKNKDYYYEGGGAYCCKSSPTLTHNTISQNSASGDQYGDGGDGGGVYCYQSSPTLTNNTISGNSTHDYGGGVDCESNSSPALTHNTLSGNTATVDGGGVSCLSSSPTLTHNTLSRNTAKNGGGVCCLSSSPTLTHNTITHNSAGYGGGVWGTGASSLALTDNTISGNKATYYGGGVSCNQPATISNNTISGNTAGWSGGGVDCESSSLALSNDTISGNSAGNWGGGVYYSFNNACLPTLTNNTLNGNSASCGGGVCCYQSSPALTNNTLSGNSAAKGGGVYCISSSSPVINNTTIAFNTKGGGLYVDVTQFPAYPSSPVITYCDLYGNTGGNYVNWPKQTGHSGNISQDPLFANAAGGDFHEKSKGGRWDPTTKTWVVDTVHSPCIDAGDPTSAFDKEPKPNGGRINMGDYGDTRQASKAAPAGSSGQISLTATAAAATGSGLAQITVNLTAAAAVQVSILNVAGREVAVLAPQDLPEGLSILLWDGRSTSGTKAPAGRYLVRATARGEDGSQAQALAGLTLGR